MVGRGINKQKAIGLLCRLFDENKLSFRDIAKLKEYFDEAVNACDEERRDMEGEHAMGRGAFPTLPSRDTEEDFLAVTERKIAQKLEAKGVIASGRALTALAEITAEETELEDIYYTD